jgi:hypothetical protein
MFLQQSENAKADVAEIRKFVSAHKSLPGVYGRNRAEIQLSSVPADDERGEWTPERVGRALVDYADGGWSPFGGYAKCEDMGQLIFTVNVFND